MRKCPSCNKDLFILINLQNDNVVYVCENDSCSIDYINENGEIINES